MDHNRQLAKIVLYLAPRHAQPNTGKWRLNSNALFAEARALLPASYPNNELGIKNVFRGWVGKHAAEWQGMVAEAERDPENYFADIVSRSPTQPQNTLPTTITNSSDGVSGKKEGCDIKSLARAYLHVKRTLDQKHGRGEETTFGAVKRLLKSTCSEETLRNVFHQWKCRHKTEWRRELAEMEKDPHAYFKEIVSGCIDCEVEDFKLKSESPSYRSFQREADPDSYHTSSSLAKEKLLLPRVILHLAPAYARPDGRWQLQKRAMYAEAKELLSSLRSPEALIGLFRAWMSDNPDEWERMEAEAKKDPNYLADIVSV